MAKLKLNKKQLSAIKHEGGPLLIIAGAGTGKTTVITNRIKHLIVDKDVQPDRILALTFTEKAAFEMQERIDELLPYGYTNLWINTFHSFCDRILREEAHSIGLDSSYKLLSESESILILSKNIFNVGLNLYKPLGNPTKFVSALIKHFSRLKDEDVSPNEYIRWAQDQKSLPRRQAGKIKNQNELDTNQYVELAIAYKKYEEIKIKNSSMDFADLISNTLLLFRKRQFVLGKYQKQFKYILVDEFQDTNYAQNALAILLAGKDKNINVVADDDQSIYRFRGAAVSNVLQFKKNFKNAKIITLTDNYRSTQLILNSSHDLIKNNNPNRLEVIEKINKKLISHSKKPNKKIELIKENRSEDETDAIANKIIELSREYDYKDFAILVRANNHSQIISATLQRRGVPYQFLGPGYLFTKEEVKDLIAYILFLSDLTDSVSLYRVLSIDSFGISQISLNYLLNWAKKKNKTLFESLYYLDQLSIKPSAKNKLIEIRKMIENHMFKSKKEKAGQILYYFLFDSGLIESFENSETLKNERRIQNIAKFFDRIKSFETERPDSNIYTVSEWLALMIQMGDSPMAADSDLKDENAVNILTVHSSKGLEFKVVFLINLVSDRFPSRSRTDKIPIPLEIVKEGLPKDTDFHTEEERRLFYVGMTRAKERLFFTGANFYSGGKRKKKLSPFIYEALPDLKIKEEIDEKSQQLSLTQSLSSFKKIKEIEKEVIPYKINYLTYSNLQMFDICPLHYKAKVIYNIPTPTSSVQSFGISLHNTLYSFYKLIQESKKPTEKDLQNFLKNEWINEGYQNKLHEKERYSQAKKILKDFYKSQKPFIKPLGLEMPFSFRLDSGVKVFGKIDKIDKKGSGIEIIDYKTGLDNPKAQGAHRLQLAMYALAATKVKDPILNKTPENISVAIHFLDGNTKKSMSFTKEDLLKLEKDLEEKIGEIEKSEFKCSKSIICQTCEYKMLCNTT